MRKQTVLKLQLALMALLPGLHAIAQTSADFSAGLNGTYQATYSDFGNAGPFAGKQAVTLVLNGDNDTLCVDGTLLSRPYTKTTNGSLSIVFQDSSKGVFFAWPATTFAPTAAGFTLNVMQGTDTTFKGQLSGPRTSTSTACVAAASAVPTVSASMQSVFDLAAELFPDMFKTGSALGSYEGYTYKFFAGSGIYVGIKDDRIFTMGGIYGTAIKEQGTVGAVLSALQTAKANAAKPVTTTPVPTTPVPTVPVTTTPVTPSTPTSTVSGLDSSGLATLAGGSGIVFTANGVTRKYQVSNSPVSSSATGYLLSYQSEASAGALDASICVPNKPGVYACGSGVSAATQNGYFNTSQIAWIAFTGTAFGGTPLSNFGGSCTIEVLSTSPRLEGRFIAQLFGAAAGDGKVTSGYFSAPLVITASTATVGTGTGSLLLTARNASVPAKHVGTMQITQFGLEVINGVCVYSGAGAYAGSSESYILKISRAKGSGQVGGWELRSLDNSFNAVASNLFNRSIEITRASRTVRISDNFGATGSASSVKVEGSVKWTDVGDVTGC